MTKNEIKFKQKEMEINGIFSIVLFDNKYNINQHNFIFNVF